MEDETFIFTLMMKYGSRSECWGEAVNGVEHLQQLILLGNNSQRTYVLMPPGSPFLHTQHFTACWNKHDFYSIRVLFEPPCRCLHQAAAPCTVGYYLTVWSYSALLLFLWWNSPLKFRVCFAFLITHFPRRSFEGGGFFSPPPHRVWKWFRLVSLKRQNTRFWLV